MQHSFDRETPNYLMVFDWEDDFYSAAGAEQNTSSRTLVSKNEDYYQFFVAGKWSVDMLDKINGRRFRIELQNGKDLVITHLGEEKARFVASGSGPATIKALVGKFTIPDAVNEARMFLLKKWQDNPEHGSQDIGGVHFTEKMLDTEFDVNPHWNTGIGQHADPDTSFTNNYRVHN